MLNEDLPNIWLDALGRNIDALAYVFLVLTLVVTTITADRRYTTERHRNEKLQRRIQSLVLVVQFQQALIEAEKQELPAEKELVEIEPLDLSVDAMISRMGYCLTCHRLKAPAHFKLTDHLRLEDENYIPDSVASTDSES